MKKLFLVALCCGFVTFVCGQILQQGHLRSSGHSLTGITQVTNYTLVVNVTGNGSVISDIGGISCPSACAALLASGSVITLTANPYPIESFLGWSGGGCSGTGSTCVVTLNSSQSVTANFSVTTVRSLNVSIFGSGSVVSSPAAINCPPTCNANFTNGISVVLTETPSAGQSFTSWSGAGCSGSGTTCTVVMNANQSVVAAFTGGGGPLSYSARTDTCVHGYSTNPPTVSPFYNPATETCVPGATTGQFGSALVFQQGTADPLPFLRLDDPSVPAVRNISFTDPDFNSYSVFVSDNATSAATTNYSMGSDGGYDAFALGNPNNKDTLLTFQNSGSVPYLVHIIPSRFFAHTCNTTTTPCIVNSNIHGASCTPSDSNYTAPNCTHTQISNGAISFSRNPSDPPNTIYELTMPKVYKVTFTSSVDGSGYPTGASDSVSRVLYVDFSSDGPGGNIPCSLVPPGYQNTWNGGFNISNGGAITIASGGGGDYASIGNGGGGPQTLTPDTFILPTNNVPQWAITGYTVSGSAAPYTIVFSTNNTLGSSSTIGVMNAKPAAVNGSYTVVSSTATTITVTSATNPGPWVSGGFVGYTNGMYQACNITGCSSGSATTAGVEPNWASNCNGLLSTCTDGGVVWTNIGNVGGQGPGFDHLHFDPQRGCTRQNTRLTRQYQGHNQGTSWPNFGTPDPSGQWMTDDYTTCTRMGGANCGNGGTVPITDTFTLHAGDQKFQSRFGSMGATGGGSINDNYIGGTGNPLAASKNGSCTPPIPNTSILGVWASGTHYAAGNYVWSPTDHAYYKAKIALTSTIDPASDSGVGGNWSYSSSYCYSYVIDYYATGYTTPIVRPILEIGPRYGGDGHNAAGYLFDYRGGKYYSHMFGSPNCSNSIYPCFYPGSPNPGIPALAFALPNDGHPTARNFGTLDAQPIFDPTADVPAWGGVNVQGVLGGGTGVGGYCCAGYTEEVSFSPSGLSHSNISSISGSGTVGTVVTVTSLSASAGQQILIAGTVNWDGNYPLLTVNNATRTYTFSANTTGSESTGVATLQALYRHGHNYCSGSNAGFGIQNCIGVISQDGLMLAYTSDFMNTRGDRLSGSATCANPIRGQYQPPKNGCVTLNDFVMPVTGNTNLSVYQITSVGSAVQGTCAIGQVQTSATAPTWGTCQILNSTCTDSKGIVYTNKGPNSCRGDIGLMDVSSAHSLP
jgi:hypothetical protein